MKTTVVEKLFVAFFGDLRLLTFEVRSLAAILKKLCLRNWEY
ncbi:hypothetical protein ACQFX9_21490 [Aliinostoc sp. HNIBRCY26]